MERKAYFDNAKVLLIFLVVFGHMIQPFIDGSRAINALYLWIYTFHMPAFIFLAGFFAKGSGNKKYIINLAKTLLIPYIIFQIIYTGYYFLIGKSDWQTGMFYPHWSLWFLFSLFSWHVLLSIFKKIPAVLSVATAVLLGLIVGYFGDIGHAFSLSRTFVLFPFFLIGFWLTKDHANLIQRKGIKIVSAIVMFGIAIAIYIAPELNSGWLLASVSYGELGLPEYGAFARLLVYITSAVMVVCVLAWVPKSNNRVTYLGSRTLYVYLLHGFFIQFFRKVDLFEVNHIFDLLMLGVLSALIVLILSSRPILGMWQPFIEGRATMIKNQFSKRHKEDPQNLNT